MLVWFSTGSTAAFVNAITFLLSAITLAAAVELGKRMFRRDLYLNGRTPLEGWMQEYSTLGAGWEAIRALRNGLRLRCSIVFLYFVISVEMGILALIAPIDIQPASERNVRANYRLTGTGLCLSRELVPRESRHWTTKALGIVAQYVKAGGDMEHFVNTVGEDDESIPVLNTKALVPGSFVNETMRPGELDLTVRIDEHGIHSYAWNTKLLFGKDAVVYGNNQETIRPKFQANRPFVATVPIVITLYDDEYKLGAVQRTAFCYGNDIRFSEFSTSRSFKFSCNTYSIALESSFDRELIHVRPDMMWRFMSQMRLETNEKNLRFVARAGIQIRLLTHILNDQERCGVDEFRYLVPTKIEPITLGSIAAMLLTTCIVLGILFYYIVLTRKSVDWNGNIYRLINLLSRRQEKRGEDCTELEGRSGAFVMVIQVNGPDYKAHLTVAEAQAAEDFGLARKKPRWLVADSSGYMQSRV